MGTIKTTNIETITGSGTLTLGQSGETITIPSGVTITNNGTQTGFGGTNTPAFFAYRSGSNQSMPNAAVTVIQMNSEVYDTDSAYDTSTYRFTPQTAGKYLLHTQYETNGGGDQVIYIAYILKNGSSTGGSQFLHRGSGGASFSLSTTSVLEANGSSDYFQAGFYQGSSSVELLTGIQNTYFTAYKIIE